MNQKFEWQAEDNDEWPVSTEENDPMDHRNIRRRRLSYAVLLLVLLSIAFFFIQRIERFVGETGVEIEQEVAASNELVLEAARLADPEILASLISGRDQVWADAQLLVVGYGYMFERSPFGLELREDSFNVDDIEVSPELDSADVTMELSYDIMSTLGATETISLKHILHYRRSDDRWLLAPPGSDFWGSSVVDEGYYVTIRYPEQDAMIGNRLALDLEALVAAFCNLESMASCTTRMPVKISLVTDPSSLWEAGNEIIANSSKTVLELPSPTLFGNPGSDNAFRALYRSYGEHLVGYLMASESDYVCCNGQLFYEALLTLRLHQLDLYDSPLSSTLISSLGSDPLALGESLWQASGVAENALDSNTSALVLTLISYITQRWNDIPLTSLQRNISNATTFNDWIESTITNVSPEDFCSGWQEYLLDLASS